MRVTAVTQIRQTRRVYCSRFYSMSTVSITKTKWLFISHNIVVFYRLKKHIDFYTWCALLLKCTFCCFFMLWCFFIHLFCHHVNATAFMSFIPAAPSQCKFWINKKNLSVACDVLVSQAIAFVQVAIMALKRILLILKILSKISILEMSWKKNPTK